VHQEQFLVVDRHLPFVADALQAPADGWARVGLSSLMRGTAPQDRWAGLCERFAGSPGPWGPAVTVDQPMRAQFAQPPAPARVFGTSMDFHHGASAAVASARRLPARTSRRQLGEGVLVGVVDTGMRSHPWLEGGYLASPADFEPFDRNELADGPEHQAGHGTFITGLVLQQAQAAGVWVERALEPEGEGLASAVAEAALTLAGRGVHVLNLSLGCYADDPGAERVMGQLVQDLRRVNPELVVVAAAGNRAHGQTGGAFWPAALPGVVAVGAAERTASGTVCWAPWSNRGPWVDLAAPGTDLLSTYLYDRRGVPATTSSRTGADAGPPMYRGWARWSGTSFSAAVVSGVLAALMDEESVSAPRAVELLRSGAQWPGVRVEAERGVPAVPVVRPVDWSDDLVESSGAVTGEAGAERPWWGRPPTYGSAGPPSDAPDTRTD